MDAVITADPDLSTSMVAEVVQRVLPGAVSRANVARELYSDPHRLVSADPTSKLSTQQLIKALVAAGSKTIRRPHCTLCRRVRDLKLRLPSGGMACQMCARILSAEPCQICGKLRPPQARTDGNAICQYCWDRSRMTGSCDTCGGLCVETAASPRLCQRCRPRPATACSRCRRVRPVHSRVGQEAVCSRCSKLPQRICATCRHPRQRSDPDPGCGLCGATEQVRCGQCGDDWFGFGIGPQGCVRCRLHQRVRQLTDGAELGRVEQLTPFLEGLGQSADPRASLAWLSRARAAKARTVVQAMLKGTSPVTHHTLDVAAGSDRGRATSLEYLREMLVVSGVLPARDEYLHRLQRAISVKLDSCHQSDRSVLQQYATWNVLARARSRVAAGKRSASVVRTAMSNFVVAAEFMAWLRAQEVSLLDLSQKTVDYWASQNPGYRDALAVFLRWASRRQLSPRVQLEQQSNWPPSTQTSIDPVALTRRYLGDPTISSRDRLAACLVVIYGQPVRRIANLMLDDIERTRDTVTIKLGRTPVELPPRLAELLDSVIKKHQDEAPGLSRGFAATSQWLFPGRSPSQPISSETLRRRIIATGVPSIRSARNTALTTLSRAIPAVVLADLLGMSLQAAVRWNELSGGTWAVYTASRATPGTLAGRAHPDASSTPFEQ